jgi:hypothetical protein
MTGEAEVEAKEEGVEETGVMESGWMMILSIWIPLFRMMKIKTTRVGRQMLLVEELLCKSTFWSILPRKGFL